jgi:hypothetical protein
MALSKPRTIYGIHEAVLYSRTTGLPYGTLRVLGGSTLSLTGELVQLTGGSSPYSWDAQDGNITAEMSLKPKEIPNFLFKVLLGKEPTEVLADPGNVTTLANIKGTSVFDATTGIASVGVKSGSEDDVKFGKYIVKAVTATTVDVYGQTSVDFRRGTDKQYVDDTLKITATPLTITGTAGVTELPDFGIEFTGGSGTVDMTPGDTAEFEANPPSITQMDVTVGELGVCIPEFGALVTAQKKSSGEMWLFDCFKVKALGFPFGLEEKAFNEAELKATLLYDSVKDGVMKARYIDPTNGCG